MERSCYFLVAYEENENSDIEDKNKDEIVGFLEKEKFERKYGFWWRCPWFFIDIVNKVFIPGRPGVCYGTVIGDHAITFEEFKTIYSMYKKYKGLRVLQMKK